MVFYPQSALMFKFGRNSCYIFSLARAVEILAGVDLRASEVLATALRSTNVSGNAFVYDAGSLCEEFIKLVFPDMGGKRFTVSKEMQESTLPNVCNIQHWVYSSNGYTAHHFKLDDWDPLYDKSQAERLGKIVDFRIVSLTASE